MPQLMTADLCPDDRLVQLTERLGEQAGGGVALIEDVLRDFPRDPRLHFLKGSILASLQSYGEAKEAIAIALKEAPDYDIARFQLGMLHFTSGDADLAQQVWRPLESKPAKNPLRLFVRGLAHMARDEFEPAIEALRRGIALNTENPVLNNDMQMLIDGINALQSGPPASDATSAADLLLRQSTTKATRH